MTAVAGFPLRGEVFDAHWRPRSDPGAVLNLKSCEMQHPDADRLLAGVLAELGTAHLWRYPHHTGLLARMAELDGVDQDQVLLTAGSCGAIGLVVDGLAQPARRILAQEPVFDSWSYYAALRGVPVTRCAGVLGSPPAPTTAALVTAMRATPPAVVALTNPGNPTGMVFDLEEVAGLAELAAERGHVLVVDECYGAFAGVSHVPLVRRYPNVVVLRSLSKAWALAGARLAVVFGSAPVVDYLRRFRTDSAVSAPAVALALLLSNRMSELRAIWADVAAIRSEFTATVLAGNPQWTALASRANFTTFCTEVPGDGDRIAAALAVRGVRIRSLDDLPGFGGCLRLSLAARDHLAPVAALLADLG